MKKFYISIIAVAALLTACDKNEVLVEETGVKEKAISFETFANTATRNAENSSSATKHDLSNHHNAFGVWGYKKVANNDPVEVFNNQKVTYESSKWTYTPVRFWDKSADHYEFYAVAPYDASKWTWNATNKKFSYKDFSLTGKSLDASSSINADAVFSGTGDVDLMLAHDVTNYKTYTETAVNLEFDHLLSRLNIGVRKAEALTATVTLNEVKVYNMKSNGTFDESLAAASTSGNNTRWGAAATPATFTAGVGYAPSTALTLTTSYNYVYQSLCIPQTVAYASSFNLDGSDKSTTCAPYLNIKYTINEETYSYFYNLADIFNGKDATTNVDFFEGWQNNLMITINPYAIEFTAEVYEWVNKMNVEVDVPNE